ncbi:hypothetical protein niasHT_010962 [Heterodera trifolii]|uniref:Uncharacterized protein n=1 Tax=Heterodera trifolii TaxID=157864 RepID=A0ABD2LG78_9BILA
MTFHRLLTYCTTFGAELHHNTIKFRLEFSKSLDEKGTYSSKVIRAELYEDHLVNMLRLYEQRSEGNSFGLLLRRCKLDGIAFMNNFDKLKPEQQEKLDDKMAEMEILMNGAQEEKNNEGTEQWQTEEKQWQNISQMNAPNAQFQKAFAAIRKKIDELALSEALNDNEEKQRKIFLMGMFIKKMAKGNLTSLAMSDELIHLKRAISSPEWKENDCKSADFSEKAFTNYLQSPHIEIYRLLCILLDYQSFLKELTTAPGKQWSTVYRCFQKSPCENLEGHRESVYLYHFKFLQNVLFNKKSAHGNELAEKLREGVGVFGRLESLLGNDFFKYLWSSKDEIKDKLLNPNFFRDETRLLANYHQTISNANELKRTRARLLADLTVLYNHFGQLALTFSDTKFQQAIEKEAKYLWLYFRTLYDTIFIGKSDKTTERMSYTSFIIDAMITGN